MIDGARRAGHRGLRKSEGCESNGAPVERGAEEELPSGNLEGIVPH